MHDKVVSLACKRPESTHWPAWTREDGLLVDLRLYNGKTLEFCPEKLREIGIAENFITQAAESNPPGFLLFAR